LTFASIIYHDRESDTAIVVFDPGEGDEAIPFPEKELSLWGRDTYLRIGNEVGWVGFPAVSPEHLCFFSGRVSAFRHATRDYLIDGVAINGVSGGPTFIPMGKEPSIIGVISAYISNRATGVALPGVAVVQDVESLHEWVSQFRSVAEARKAEPPTPDAPSAT
jgi:hypothetical protein